ncbi:CHAT domain-containing protein [Cyathus striatus]|nr:CHAT domain-containing protein [Cyathus striatus]
MSSVDSAFNYFILSYTPTVGAIIKNVPSINPQGPFKMMVVIDPKSLPQTVSEMKEIEKHISSDVLHKFGTNDSPALVDDVVLSLSSVSIAHFACHGQQFTDNSLKSSLKLQDSDLMISSIMEKHMPNATLSFLCACETAMGDSTLLDEVMHLGATLLFSGFRGVITTMWSIDDMDGPVIADAFYKYLLKDNATVPNMELAAEAVHFATAELRKQGVEFRRWAPFIHLGN